MRAVVDGDRVRIYFNDGRPFYTFYNINQMALELANSELTAVERIVYKEAFRCCRKKIPIPEGLKEKVHAKLLEIELDKAMNLYIP